MENIALYFAKAMSEDMLLDQLQEAITKYKADKTKATKDQLRVSVILLSIRVSTEGQSLEETIKHVENMKEAKDLYGRITGDDKKN